MLHTPITYALRKKNLRVKFNLKKLPFYKKPKISNPYTRINKIFKKKPIRYMVRIKLKKNKNWDTPWDMLPVLGCCQVWDIKLNKSLMNIYQ